MSPTSRWRTTSAASRTGAIRRILVQVSGDQRADDLEQPHQGQIAAAERGAVSAHGDGLRGRALRRRGGSRPPRVRTVPRRVVDRHVPSLRIISVEHMIVLVGQPAGADLHSARGGCRGGRPRGPAAAGLSARDPGERLLGGPHRDPPAVPARTRAADHRRGGREPRGSSSVDLAAVVEPRAQAAAPAIARRRSVSAPAAHRWPLS